MAARSTKGTAATGWPAVVRERIKTSMLINRLTDHAVGKITMEATQVRAIEILLKKTLPDLSQVEANVNVTRDASEMSDADLTDIAAGRSAGAFEASGGEEEPNQVH